MEDQNEQNQGNSPEFKRSNKSAMERGMNVKNKAENTKKLWDKVKGMKAFAPLATVMGYIAVALIIIFLVVGFVGFFITMPGLFFNKFIQFCQGFFEDMIGQELIQIGGDEVIDLANYIEDLGYDLEAFGFATGNSITRESSSSDDENKGGRRGKITGIDLSGTGESSYNVAIYTMSFALSEYKRLESSGGAVVYPVGVLSSTNIVKTTKNENGRTDYYKAWDSSKNDIDFFDSNGNAIKYKIIFNSSGSPEFVRASSSDTDTYTYDDLISGKTINGYTVQVDGISVNDYKRLYNNNKLNSNYTLKNQATYINEYNNFMVENDITTGNDSEMWSTKIAMSRLLGVTVADGQSLQNTAKSYVIYMNTEHPGMTLGEYLVSKITDDNQFDKENLFGHMSSASTENIGESYVDAMIDEATNKNQNLYAYILANERTYSAQNIRVEGWTNLLDFAFPFSGLGEWARQYLDSEKVTKLNFPANYGMLIFPTGSPSALNEDFEVEIDRQSNTMVIKTTRNTGFFEWTTDQVKWNMSGWTSRYGKPVELSLALHLSTMAPDFVYDFCMHDNLQTRVNIAVNPVTYHIDYTYRTSAGTELTKEEIIAKAETLEDSIPFIDIDAKLFTKDICIGTYNVNGDRNYGSVENPEWIYKNGQDTGEQNLFNVDISKQSQDDLDADRDLDIRTLQYYPIGILNNTSIITMTNMSLKKGSSDYYFGNGTATIRYYKAVDKSGNPISIYDNNGNYINYSIKFKSGSYGYREPYFEETTDSSNGNIFQKMIENEVGYSEDKVNYEKKYMNDEYFMTNSVCYDLESGNIIDSLDDITDSYKNYEIISLNVMSLNDLQLYFNRIRNDKVHYNDNEAEVDWSRDPRLNYNARDLRNNCRTDKSLTFEEMIFSGNYQYCMSGGWRTVVDRQNLFACADRYLLTIKAYDKLINEIITKESDQNAEEYLNQESVNDYTARGHYLGICMRYGLDFNLVLKSKISEWNTDNLDLYTYNFNSLKKQSELDENEKNYKHNSADVWDDLRKMSKKESDTFSGYDFRNFIDEFGQWITGEVTPIIAEKDEEGYDALLHAQLYVLLSGSIREFLDTNGMTINELLTVNDILSRAADDVTTYQPYITSVTNHWYRDLDFMEARAYDITNVSRGSEYQYNPTGEAAETDLSSLGRRNMV